MKRAIPVWLTILASLVTLSGLAFSANLYFSPQTFFPEANFLAKDTRHFTDMWAIRQLTFTILFIYALVRQQPQILKLALWLIIIVNVLTIADAIWLADKRTVEESLVFTLLTVIMLTALYKRTSQFMRASRAV